LAGGLLGVGGLAVGAGYVAANRQHPIASAQFVDLAHAVGTLERLAVAPLHTREGWDLARVLRHATQSIEYSLEGFPQPKPAWFQATLGTTAFAVFSARGRMSHNLTEPIPGAPAIAGDQPLGPAAKAAIEMLHRFDRHAGALAPHFAYGALGKADYLRAHLMHLADHWQWVDGGT